MDRETKEHWQELCERAAKEQDPNELLILIQQINRLLEGKKKSFTKRVVPIALSSQQTDLLMN